MASHERSIPTADRRPAPVESTTTTTEPNRMLGNGIVGGVCPAEPPELTAQSRDITAFGRTVTATAGTLIAPFNDGHAPPYTNAMSDLSRQLAQRPSLQRRMLSFNNHSPSELVRSKLSTAEIQYRALTHVPDEMLRNIPVQEHTYSLFQGFQATLPDEASERGRGRHRRKSSGRHKALDGVNGTNVTNGTNGTNGTAEGHGPPSLQQMGKEKSALTRQLEMLAIRKNLASSEIREIDIKIQNLNRMRHIVLDRLARLEEEEAEVERESMRVSMPLIGLKLIIDSCFRRQQDGRVGR